MARRGVTFFFAFLAILFAWNGTATSDPGSDEPLMVGAAQPMTLPLTTAASSPGNVTIPNEMIGSFGYVSGFIGSGETDPVQIIVPLSETHVTANDAASENNTELTQIRVRNFGTSMLPFSTQRADLEVRGKELFKTNNLYPYRATGLLDFCTSSPCSSDANRYYCTASLIGPSVLITAAHCVAPYGKKTIYYTDGKFTPGYSLTESQNTES